MDWSKAKNILIVALLATNIFLLFTYISKNEDKEGITDQEVLFAVLEGKNIFVDMELPNGQDKMPAITIEYNTDKEALIEKNLKSHKYIVSQEAENEEYRKVADQFLKDCGLNSDTVVFDGILEEEEKKIVRYRNTYKDIIIGDSFIDVSYTNGSIINITRQLFTPQLKSKKKLNVISPEEALLIFMSEKQTEEEFHVEDMKLVFWVNDSGFDGEAVVSDTAFPAWQITYNGGITKYIEAYKA